MRRPGTVASASCVADTPPSTEFSIAIMAATARPLVTSASASPTLFTERQCLPAASGTCLSAASVKVPAGPRYEYVCSGGVGAASVMHASLVSAGGAGASVETDRNPDAEGAGA